MPYQPHARVQLEGKLNSTIGSGEIWSSGINVYSGGTSFQLTDPVFYLDAIKGPLATWFHANTTHMAVDATLEVIKVNNINASGHYEDAVTHEALVAGPNNNGSDNQQSASFTCVCFTWETGFARGYAHRGRSYFPNYTANPDGSFVPVANVVNYVAAARDFLTIIGGSEDGGGHEVVPAVFSNHASEVRPITGVSVDNIYDYQSRRKNRLTSVRTSANWPVL